MWWRAGHPAPGLPDLYPECECHIRPVLESNTYTDAYAQLNTDAQPHDSYGLTNSQPHPVSHP
ncbi:hypothetical protein [Kocuria marina]|uniref:hypothetical protein n=1 Tax=Kocuria marina TaxID=223184 RepID=UPI0022E4EC1B|nr:hypothetical protein [Kocuria marina]